MITLESARAQVHARARHAVRVYLVQIACLGSCGESLAVVVNLLEQLLHSFVALRLGHLQGGPAALHVSRYSARADLTRVHQHSDAASISRSRSRAREGKASTHPTSIVVF